MELILLSIFGTASLFVLELCGLVYERWVREPHLAGSSFPTPPAASQPGGAATIRAITKHGRIDGGDNSKASGQGEYRWFFVDDVPTERLSH